MRPTAAGASIRPATAAIPGAAALRGGPRRWSRGWRAAAAGGGPGGAAGGRRRGGGAGGGGGGGPGGSVGGTLQRGGDGKASRSIEEIKLVFERNKGAIYSIY